MTVQEIFDLPNVRTLENEILAVEANYGKTSEGAKKEVIGELLRLRKSILDNEFVMDADYAALLGEFNEVLRQTLVKLEHNMVEAYDAVKGTGTPYEVEAVGKCFLGYEYPELHPVQTDRARKMWDILNGSIDDYVDLYDDGIDGFNNIYRGTDYDKEHLLDNLDTDGFNYNHGLEGEYTDSLHIIMPAHLLYHDKSFSIFDILWVRSFDVEVHVEYDYHSN